MSYSYLASLQTLSCPSHNNINASIFIDIVVSLRILNKTIYETILIQHQYLYCSFQATETVLNHLASLLIYLWHRNQYETILKQHHDYHCSFKATETVLKHLAKLFIHLWPRNQYETILVQHHN